MSRRADYLAVGLAPIGMQPQYLGNYHANGLTPSSLQSDHHCLRRLLRNFETAVAPSARRDALRLAIDLFDTHAQLETALPGAPRVRDRAALFDLIEAIEMTDPASKLYLARGMEFKQRLEAHLIEEEARPHAATPRAPTFDEDLLHFRDVLLERAEALFRRNPATPALAA